jgi:hypothetical protein
MTLVVCYTFLFVSHRVVVLLLSSSPSLYHALQGRPCFFTIFASSDIKLHPTHVSRVDAILETHMGELLAPPASLERFNEIGPFVSQDIEVGSWCCVAE